MISLFADDCRISKVINNRKDAAEMQRDLDGLYRWIYKNKLEINLKKCQKITFSRNDSILDTNYFLGDQKVQDTDTVKDLGIILDKRWTFNDHLGYLLPPSRPWVLLNG